MEQHRLASYEPSSATLQGLRAVSLVAVIGPTAVGKTTIMHAAIEQDERLAMVVGDADRSPREGEQNGRDYHFKTTEEMHDKAETGEYVQVAPSPTGELYATDLASYHPGKIALMAVLATAIPTFRALLFKDLRTVFVLPPSWESWESRLNQRPLPNDKLRRRMHEAAISLEFARMDEEVVFLINDDLNQATQDFLSVAQGLPLSDRLQTQQQRGRELCELLLDAVGRYDRRLQSEMANPA